MGDVIVDLSVSLDGFIAGPGDGPELRSGGAARASSAGCPAARPAGDSTSRLVGRPRPARVVIDEWVTSCGAMISGRRTFDIAGGWADGHPIDAPDLRPHPRAPRPRAAGARRSASPTTLDEALDGALAVAGDKDVSVAGASIAQQVLGRREAGPGPGQRHALAPGRRRAPVRPLRRPRRAGAGPGHRVRGRDPPPLPRGALIRSRPVAVRLATWNESDPSSARSTIPKPARA